MTSEDLHQQMLRAQTATTEKLTKGDGGNTSPLSGLSTNETLFLADSGWESLDICCGAAVFGMRQDTVSTWGPLQDDRASEALAAAMASAVKRLRARCVSSGVHGVIGTTTTTEIQPRYVAVSLVGTGIGPVHASKSPSRPFTSNLSPRDFILLQQAGWQPVGLASGCRFIRAYRRGPTQAVAQKSQNVELENPTWALAQARSEAMVILAERARDFGAQGVIQLSLSSGPIAFAPHVLSFVAWGTAITRTDAEAVYPVPRTSVLLNDAELGIDPASLAGNGRRRRVSPA
jgi:uncharacterized protein YbjQ (UPF0145 family)